MRFCAAMMRSQQLCVTKPLSRTFTLRTEKASRGFTGRSHTWWMIAFGIQFWHHFEHFLLFYQAQTQHNFFGGAVPTSVGQIWIPRIELHLIYNALVFAPMIVAMYYHMYPAAAEAPSISCSCARHRRHEAISVAA